MITLILAITLIVGGCYDAGYKDFDEELELEELSDEFEEELDTTEVEDTLVEESEEVEVPEVKETEDKEDTKEMMDTEEDTEKVSPEMPSNAGTQEVQDRRLGKVNEIRVIEGEMVKLTPEGTDADGDRIKYLYSEPFDVRGRWRTKVGDVGEYTVEVTATDGKSKVVKTLKVVVQRKNSLPVIVLSNVIVNEGETVTLNPQVTDADPSDHVRVRYEGWMRSNTYTTTYTDAGTHTVVVIAEDGKDEVRKEVTITVKDVNRAPEFNILVG
jgi:hypothetical protein